MSPKSEAAGVLPALERPGPIGWIGLGNMGMPMAQRLVATGWSVHVADLDASRVATAVAAGAVESDLATIAVTCPVVAVIVWNVEQITALMNGPDGLLAKVAPGTTIVVHSTVSPASVRRVAEVAQAAGARVVDAPVSGGASGRAASGQLTVMVGGADVDVARVRPVLESVARRVDHVGPIGAGSAAKLANNMMSIGNIVVALEALELARTYGVDDAVMLDVAAASSGHSEASDNLAAGRIAASIRSHGTGTAAYETLAKDLFIAVDAGRDEHVHLAMAALAASLSPDIVRRWHEATGSLDEPPTEERKA